jgi:hypothetical protein
LDFESRQQAPPTVFQERQSFPSAITDVFVDFDRTTGSPSMFFFQTFSMGAPAEAA